VLSTAKSNRLEWVNTHVSLAFSDREKAARTAETMEAITQVKDSMHSIFVQAVGIQGPRKTDLFGLHRTSQGGIDTLLFITDIRLDVAGHAIVADAFVLPLYDEILDTIGPALQSCVKAMCQVNISYEEHIAWKVLLPSLVERCRTWDHTPHCAYTKRGGRIPLSTEHGKPPICDCGKGKVTDAFRRRKEWSPFLPYVTRVALSPLFAVSYLESVAGQLKAAFPAEGRRDAGAGDLTRCGSCKRLLASGKQMVCSRCKKVAYCDKQCQTGDWKRHKQVCQKV
jgi:hypothetical protein